MTIADDLAEIASIGPFFDVTTHEKSSAVLAPWRPMSELITFPQRLAGRVDRVRAALAQASHQPVADIEQRVAASMTRFGLTARLLSPVLAVTCTTVSSSTSSCTIFVGRTNWAAHSALSGHQQCTETADTDRLLRYCRRVLPGSARSPPSGWPFDFLRGPIAELITTVGLVRPVSPMIMWGNVASAVNKRHHTDPHAPAGPWTPRPGPSHRQCFSDPHFEAPPLLMILSDAVAAA